jgi:hypothetical protein
MAWLLVTGYGRARRSMMPTSLFHPRDLVRIVRLEAEDRDVDGSSHPPPQPRVGEIATVVEEVEDGIYLVERCTDDGRTLWMAEFLSAELDLVQRVILRERSDRRISCD